MNNLLDLPKKIPAPIDTGECNHLEGTSIPNIFLESTNREKVNFSTIKNAIIFVYPMTGRPDEELPDGWDDIPGARGCTPQACSFRDNMQELKKYNYKVFGLSAQNTQYQKEAVERLHLNYSLVSDENFLFQQALNLPTFTVNDKKLLKRVTLIIKDGMIIKKFFPVFPTDKNIFEVVDFLKKQSNK